MRNMLAVIVAVCCAQSAGAAPTPGTQPAAAAPSITVERVLARYVEALGGETALRRITSRTTRATLEVEGIGAVGTMEIHEKAPNKMLVVSKGDLVNAVEGCDGTAAWRQDASGVKDLAGAELAASKRDADFYSPLRMKENYATLVLKGKEKVGEREAYRVDATPAGGEPQAFYFDCETGLLIRRDVKPAGADSATPTHLQDYREVDGVRVPFLVRVESGATLTIKISQIQQNVPIEDARFQRPKNKLK